jgi:uncharacterized damage-inducible protein DinB
MKRSCAITIALLFALPLFAAKPAAVAPKGFRSEFLADLDEAQKKIIDLAAAVPADKYSWRPANGVRSISEVYTHIAGANYFLATFVGAKPPADMPQDIEKITDKTKVLAELRKSFEFLRATFANTPDADFEKRVKMFNDMTTERGVYVTILTHLHEHLGQSIAYARMNGVVPPWSAKDSR